MKRRIGCRRSALSEADSSADGSRSPLTAVALFVERRAQRDNRFELSDENAPIIADICRRLDGIPLAIELAASRVKILSPINSANGLMNVSAC